MVVELWEAAKMVMERMGGDGEGMLMD